MSDRHATAPQRGLLHIFASLGSLRVTLVVVALVLLLAVPKPGTHPEFHGWGMVPTLIVPTLMPMVFMVMLLDVMMSAVFMVDKRGAERVRLRYIVFMELLLAITLMVVWYPYFRAIMSP